MKAVKSIIHVVGIVVKYSAIVMAIIKGLQVMYEELKDIKTDEKEVEKA